MIPDRFTLTDPAELEALSAVLDDGRLSGGATILGRYETALASQFQSLHAIAVNSGTSALHAVLHVLGARSGKEVMVPATAPLPTAMPILSAGATPVIVDVRPGSLALDPEDVARKLSPRTIAAINLPLWGYPAYLSEVALLLDAAGVPVIEDAAQAHGTVIAGRPAGTLGIAGCFSTHDRKLLATGEGGFVLTDDHDLAERVEFYTRLGHLRGLRHGVNYKLAAPLAAIGLHRLGKLGIEIDRRREIAGKLLAALPSGGGLRELAYREEDRPNYYCLVLWQEGGADAVATHLTDHGLPPDSIRWGYRALYERELFAAWRTSCPNAEALVRSTFQIPVHSRMTTSERDRIRRALATVPGGRGGR